MVGYPREIELKTRRLFATLSEKDRRRYAGIEAAKLGHGGMEYIAGLFELEAKQCTADFLNKMRILCDDHLPRGNYRTIPLEN